VTQDPRGKILLVDDDDLRRPLLVEQKAWRWFAGLDRLIDAKR